MNSVSGRARKLQEEWGLSHIFTRKLDEVLTAERTKGEEFMWNLAHEPAKCGHARANWKDPQWGTPAYKGNEKCEACQAIAVERERVRKMCVRRLGEIGGGHNTWQQVIIEAQEVLRQLDLTALSSTEKGKGGDAI